MKCHEGEFCFWTAGGQREKEKEKRKCCLFNPWHSRPSRAKREAPALSEGRGRQVSLSVFPKSLLASSCICCSQITAEMPPSVIVVWWPAEETEMSAGLNGKLPEQLLPDCVCVGWYFNFCVRFSVCLCWTGNYITFNGVYVCVCGVCIGYGS